MAKILVVDDALEIRKLIVKILEKAGYETIEAEDGEEALQLFKKFSPPLIITDVVMPGKNGIEIIMEIREINPDVKFIVISGGGHVPAEKYLALAEAINVEKTFNKPIDPSELLDTVKSLTDEL